MQRRSKEVIRIDTITHIVTTLLVCGLPLLARAQQPLPLVPASQRPVFEAHPPEPSGFFVSATVRHIDHQTGLVNLDSEVGTFSAVASPHDIEQLHQGDVVAVYIVDNAAPTLRT